MNIRLIETLFAPTVGVLFALAGALISDYVRYGWLVSSVIGLGAGYVIASLYQITRSWPAHKHRLTNVEEIAISAHASPWFDRVVQPLIPLPPLTGWVLHPEAAGYLVRTLEERKPKVVLELGSGVSTLLVAYMLERNGFGRVFSVDADLGFAEQTNSLITAHGLSHRVDVRHAPLRHTKLEDWQGLWFDHAAFGTLEPQTIDFVLIDGPPRHTAHQARYPALPSLQHLLSANACLFLDDSDRSDEIAIVRRWEKLGWTGKTLPLGNGVAILERRTEEDTVTKKH